MGIIIRIFFARSCRHTADAPNNTEYYNLPIKIEKGFFNRTRVFELFFFPSSALSPPALFRFSSGKIQFMATFLPAYTPRDSNYILVSVMFQEFIFIIIFLSYYLDEKIVRLRDWNCVTIKRTSACFTRTYSREEENLKSLYRIH